jgi:adenosine deaminase
MLCAWIVLKRIRKLYHVGIRVTMNTDNASVFGRGISEEFLGLIRLKYLLPQSATKFGSMS